MKSGSSLIPLRFRSMNSPESSHRTLAPRPERAGLITVALTLYTLLSFACTNTLAPGTSTCLSLCVRMNERSTGLYAREVSLRRM